MIRRYRDLDVWKKSIQLVKQVYKISENFPKHETYTLTSQMRRSAISVASNIAEGHARNYTKEYIRFSEISYGSLAELETQVVIAFELNYITQEELDELFAKSSEIGKMLNGLLTSLARKLNPEPRSLIPVP